MGRQTLGRAIIQSHKQPDWKWLLLAAMIINKQVVLLDKQEQLGWFKASLLKQFANEEK